MGIGKNRADDFMTQLLYSSGKEISKKSCIFLLDKGLDKLAVKAIANYIAKAGIDYYLIEEDGGDEKILKGIEQGINCSSHILCILSGNSVKSWWLPYEMGYGEGKERYVKTLKVKSLEESEIPDYLKNDHISDLEQFNKYLEKVSGPYGGSLPGDVKVFDDHEAYNSANDKDAILSAYDSNHPLFEIISG